MKFKIFCNFIVIVTMYCIITYSFIYGDVKEIYIPMIIFGIGFLLIIVFGALLSMAIHKRKAQKEKDKLDNQSISREE